MLDLVLKFRLGKIATISCWVRSFFLLTSFLTITPSSIAGFCTGKFFSKTTFSKKWISIIFPTFCTVPKTFFCGSRNFLEKWSKEKSFYPPLFFQKQHFQKSDYPLFCQLSGLFLKICSSRDFLGKVIERKEKGFYLPLFSNSLGS